MYPSKRKPPQSRMARDAINSAIRCNSISNIWSYRLILSLSVISEQLPDIALGGPGGAAPALSQENGLLLAGQASAAGARKSLQNRHKKKGLLIDIENS